MELNRVYVCDVREFAAMLEPQSIHCLVTSPPYIGLRSYLDPSDPAKSRELGSEPTVGEFVANLVAVFRVLRPALRDDGVCFVNLGDSYASGEVGRHDRGTTYGRQGNGKWGDRPREQRSSQSGLPPKCLVMAPARFAIAMVEDGWILRNDIIWQKPNPMPESVTDRFTSSYEHVFLFAKNPRYWADMEAVREPQSTSTLPRFREGQAPRTRGQKFRPTDEVSEYDTGDGILPNGRNARDVWTIPTAGFPGAHYATFPRTWRGAASAPAARRACAPGAGRPGCA